MQDNYNQHHNHLMNASWFYVLVYAGVILVSTYYLYVLQRFYKYAFGEKATNRERQRTTEEASDLLIVKHANSMYEVGAVTPQ